MQTHLDEFPEGAYIGQGVQTDVQKPLRGSSRGNLSVRKSQSVGKSHHSCDRKCTHAKNPDTGETIPLNEGDKVPDGWKKLKKKQTFKDMASMMKESLKTQV